MAAFGAKAGGLGKAHESAPKQGLEASNTDAPKGERKGNQDVGKGTPGASGGFGK